MYVGLGETPDPNAPFLGTNPLAVCSGLDQWLGTCLPGTAPTTAGESAAPYQCNWFQKMWSPDACASAASPTPPLPTPPPPTGAFSTGTPAPNAGASVIAGTDANGNTIYWNTPSAQDQQKAIVASITGQVASGYVDCSQPWNELFNAQCPCTICSSVMEWGLVGAAALLALLILKR